MRIGCLQFAPQVGDVDHNLNRADAILSRANPQDLDLLVLPELAFSGYNFRSLQHISPYLEPTTAGVTSLWSRTTALKYNCFVTVGYPEKVDVSRNWPTSPEYFNSSILINRDGETILNYRKSHLYYTDETWALEGPGFFGGSIDGLGNVAMGICMDLNPYKFEAPWSAWEFTNHILHVDANLVVVSMAWLTREDARSFSRSPREPDMETLSYWLARLEPLIRAETEEEIIVVFANRCGTEDEAVYAGTSAVLGIKEGEVKVYGILGRGEKELLVVDTEDEPQAKLISEQKPKDAPPTILPESTGPLTIIDSTPAIDESYENFSPVSPTDPRHPQAYFGANPILNSENKRNSLISSTLDIIPQWPNPYSPTFDRPRSPKSRNESRNKSRNGHHERQIPLRTPSPAAVPQVVPEPEISEPTVVKSPPHSSSAAPDNFESSFTRNPLGPRSQHISPRPTSTMW